MSTTILGGQGPELHKLYLPERRGAGGALPRALVSMVEQALENQIEAGGGRSREQQKKIQVAATWWRSVVRGQAD